MGRLKPFLILFLSVCGCARAQTTISDNLTQTVGLMLNGTVQQVKISWTAFSTAGGTNVPASSTVVQMPQTGPMVGRFTSALQPNAGASPTTSYTFTFTLLNNTSGKLELYSAQVVVPVSPATLPLAGCQISATWWVQDIAQSGSSSGISATKLNGTDISLFTGLMKFTSGTPSNAAAADYIALWSGTCSGTTFLRGDGACATLGGGGTVSSFSAGNLSPLFTASVATSTSTPALTFTLSTAAAHAFLGNNTSSTTAPSYVQPAFADISGSVAASQLPNPGSSTLGGVQSIAAVSHNFLTSISTSGVPAAAQPAFTDISGSVAAGQLPNPSASTLGGIESAATVSHQWINSISTSGVPALSQPAFTDVSGSASAAQMPTNTQVWTKYTIPFASVQTAATANAVTVVSLTARQMVCGVVEKHTTAFAGTSITGLTVTIGDSNGTSTTYSPVAFNVLQTVSNTAFVANNVIGMASFAGGTIQANFTATGANLSALTAGSLDLDVCTTTLP